MSFFLTLYLAFLMLYIAHSTLLYYLVEEAAGRPVEAGRIVLPWPGRGRAVSVFAGSAGLLLLGAALFVVPLRPIGAAQFWTFLIMTTVLVVLPAGHYAGYLQRRLVRDPARHGGRRMFLPSHATPGEYRFPLLFAAAFNGIGGLVHLLR
ncbi:MAG: hypothetical protein AB1584_10270 [Pseudomonadota bacterium]